MRLKLAIVRRAAGLCLLLVMNALQRGAAVPADGTSSANCPKQPRWSYVHALRRNHRALLGAPSSRRESLGVAVPGTPLAS
jgi:hypothetical protein